MSRFKHIVLWLTLAAIFAGCAETSTVDEPEAPGKPKAISFAGFLDLPGQEMPTRSSVWPQFAENDSIIVFASHTENAADNTFSSNFMKNQYVKFDGSSWTYSPIKYWPANGKLTFRGYYPATVHFDKSDPNSGLLATTHKCLTGFEPLYSVEAVVMADNGKLTGDVSDDGKLQLAFTPLVNKVNFTATAKAGLFDAECNYVDVSIL